jgi:predicted site-specific integrase-resolvase
VNDSRPKVWALLAEPTVRRMVVEQKERATRIGFRYLERLLTQQAGSIEVVNVAAASQADLRADWVAIVYAFCARLYGQRRAKRKTEKLRVELQAHD